MAEMFRFLLVVTSWLSLLALAISAPPEYEPYFKFVTGTPFWPGGNTNLKPTIYQVSEPCGY